MGVTTLLFLCAFLIFVDCFHINVDVKSESSLTESKSESTEIKDFRNRLIDLGNSLSKRVKRPPKDGGKEFMKDLREYNEQTKKLLAMMKKDPPPGLRKFVDEYLYKHTHIIERNVPEDAIKENFNWMDSSMQRFYDERNVTGAHYTEFVTIRNRCVD
uniref:Uncharacterized protein n=1 Tax=Clastoptera arizonana TaxID=38151 RepID=A0A1B6D504_9HEMI